MKRFLHAHATHPDAHMALALAAAQIKAQRQQPGCASAPTLGWLYITDHYAARAEALLANARQRWPGVAWVGAVGLGVAASGVEYFDEPALALMLAELPAAQFCVFSGARPLLDFAANTAQIHADPATADLADLIVDMSTRTATGYLFGGLASARVSPPGRPQGEQRGAQHARPSAGALHIAEGVLRGGISGVAFGSGIAVVSRVTQGCQPVGPTRTITAADHNVITALDGTPALNCLLNDLSLEELADPREALPRLRHTLVGLSDGPGARPASSHGFATAARRDAFGSDTRVRHLIGLDPGRRGIAIGDVAEPGTQLAFCTRNTEAARRDLMRICAEIREEVEPETLPAEAAMARTGSNAVDLPSSGIAGAIYISCTGRGGAHFGAPSAELAIVRHALGNVPLVGFFAAGEIAHHHLYGYTGVLTVFPGAP